LEEYILPPVRTDPTSNPLDVLTTNVIRNKRFTKIISTGEEGERRINDGHEKLRSHQFHRTGIACWGNCERSGRQRKCL